MSTESGIIWEEPPLEGSWIARLRPFMQRPGQWGRLAGDYPQSTGSHLVYAAKGQRRRGTPLIPVGQWEFTSSGRGLRPKRVHIWVRYLGPLEDA